MIKFRKTDIIHFFHKINVSITIAETTTKERHSLPNPHTSPQNLSKAEKISESATYI